jgi:hypothetical protein
MASTAFVVGQIANQIAKLRRVVNPPLEFVRFLERGRYLSVSAKEDQEAVRHYLA